MITAKITRALHALAVRLHVAALRRARVNTSKHANRTVAQTVLVRNAIHKRRAELGHELMVQAATAQHAITVHSATIDGIDRELSKYES